MLQLHGDEFSGMQAQAAVTPPVVKERVLYYCWRVAVGRCLAVYFIN
jgi:hypothetical protein